jgi:hypothetical protein
LEWDDRDYQIVSDDHTTIVKEGSTFGVTVSDDPIARGAFNAVENALPVSATGSNIKHAPFLRSSGVEVVLNDLREQDFAADLSGTLDALDQDVIAE